MRMRVVGIDPAPTKPSTVFDGQFRRLSAPDLAEYLQQIAVEDAVLVCWDAPLTGPDTPDRLQARGFYQRRIESFFLRRATGFRSPHGISIRAYAGCPHWALSRALLGLPRVGPWDMGHSRLPFQLLTEDVPPNGSGVFIVEVHPAVAAWLWCMEHRDAAANWKYKKSAEVRDEIWEIVSQQTCLSTICNPPANDDELDALVAFALGTQWLQHDNTVQLLGDSSSGSFLVPKIPRLLAAFQAFVGLPAV